MEDYHQADQLHHPEDLVNKEKIKNNPS